MADERSSNGWRMISDTRGVNRFQGRGKAVEIPSHLHAAPPEAHMERITFYQTNYPGHEIIEAETQKLIKRQDSILPSSDKVEGQSVYLQDFPKYPKTGPTLPCPNKNNLHHLPGRVEGLTSYKREFTNPEDACLNRTELVVRSDNLRPPEAKFEQHSVSASDFQ